MVIYYIIIISLLLIGYYLCEIKKSNYNLILFLIISGVILCLIGTLRYSIGFDYFSYESIFKKISNLNFRQINFEFKNSFILYAYMNKIISLLGGNYTIFLFVYNCLITCIIIWFIYKYSYMPWISIFIYITFQFFAHSMNLFRQSIAASLFLLCYQLIIDKKFFIYLISIVIISLIHISAILLIPLYFMLNLKSSSKLIVITCMFVLILYIFDGQIFNFIVNYIPPSFSRYKDSFYWQGNSLKYIILPTIYFIFVISFKNKLLIYYPKSNILINTAFYTFIIYIYMTKHFIIERFSIYIFLFSIILVPQIINIFNIDYNKVYKKYSIFITIAIGISYFLFASNQGFHNVYPYISIFQKP